LAQRSNRKRRKERRRAREAAPPRGAPPDAGPPAPAESGSDAMARGYARGRAKDEAARAALVPLAEGERPLAVTVAGLVALGLALANIVLGFLAGFEIQGEKPSRVGIALFSIVMLTAAYGCFRVRYWAVLGMQALLGLMILLFSLLVIQAESIAALAIGLGIVLSAGTLFWFLVKSMARIQMPKRPGA